MPIGNKHTTFCLFTTTYEREGLRIFIYIYTLIYLALIRFILHTTLTVCTTWEWKNHQMALRYKNIKNKTLNNDVPHYWQAPRGAKGVKKSGKPNWRPLWWVGVLRFIPNWVKCKKYSENRVSLTIFLQFWWFFTVSSILAKS